MKTRCEKAVLLTHVTFAKALEIPFVNKAKWKKSLDHDIRKGPVFFLINLLISIFVSNVSGNLLFDFKAFMRLIEKTLKHQEPFQAT